MKFKEVNKEGNFIKLNNRNQTIKDVLDDVWENYIDQVKIQKMNPEIKRADLRLYNGGTGYDVECEEDKKLDDYYDMQEG